MNYANPFLDRHARCGALSCVTNRSPPMPHPADRIIHGKHAPVADVLRSILTMVRHGSPNDYSPRERRDVLQSLMLMVRRGPGSDGGRFFDVLRCMLFYIDELPQLPNPPAGSGGLVPDLAGRDADLTAAQPEPARGHMKREGGKGELHHLLLAWELLGDGGRPAFEQVARAYIHMCLDQLWSMPPLAPEGQIH